MDLAVTLAKLGDRAKAEAELAKLKESQAKCASTCPQAADLNKADLERLARRSAEVRKPSFAPGRACCSQAPRWATPPIWTAVGLINEGRYEAAIASLQDAKATFGAHPDILTYLGFANRKLGRFDIAESYYRQALASAPAAPRRDRILWRADGRARQSEGRQAHAGQTGVAVHLRLRRGR